MKKKTVRSLILVAVLILLAAAAVWAYNYYGLRYAFPDMVQVSSEREPVVYNSMEGVLSTAGADVETLSRRLFRSRTIGQTRLLGKALDARRNLAEQ